MCLHSSALRLLSKIPVFIDNTMSHIVLHASVYKKRGKSRECNLFSCMSGSQVRPLFEKIQKLIGCPVDNRSLIFSYGDLFFRGI